MPIIGITASSIQPSIFAGDFDSIQTVTVTTATAASVEFTNVPQTYKHLQLRIITRTDRAANLDAVRMQLNSDTTAGNYRIHYLFGDGSTTGSGTEATVAHIILYRVSGATAGASNFGTIVCDILDYTSTNKNKTTRALGGMDNNGSGEVYLNSGLYFPATIAAITNIKLTPNVGTNFVQHSSFALYGIK